MDVANITQEKTWGISAAQFSNPSYLNGPANETGSNVATGLNIAAAAAVLISFEGTYTGQTVVHEQTLDPTGADGWFSVEGAPSNGGTATSAASTSGICYIFSCQGVRHRVKVTALSTGTIEARIRLDLATLSSSSGGGGGGGGGLVEATATAAAPSYLEASDNALSTDLHGSLRNTILDSSGAAVDWALPVGVFGTGTAGSPSSGTGTSTTGVASVQGVSGGTPVNVALTQGEYETVAASQTAQSLGATGATGDYLSGLLVVPGTTSPGNVIILDNAISITVFTGGASSVSNLVPFWINLGAFSVSGAWKVTTGANVSVVAVGNFT